MANNIIIEDMPAYRLQSYGPALLSNSELLSLILGGNATEALETAKVIMGDNHNSFASVARLSLRELSNYAGMTELRAIRIAALLEVGRRKHCEVHDFRLPVCKSGQIGEYMKAMIGDMNCEFFCVLYLNRGNKITHYEVISQGGITGTVADPRIIMKRALEKNAIGIMLFHNHPSGSVNPSTADIELTTKIKEAGKFFDIVVVDHIIVTQYSYYSFSDEGIL